MIHVRPRHGGNGLWAGMFVAALLVALAPVLPAEEDLSAKESFGPLALGQKAAVVVRALGQPESRGADVQWEAIGEWVQEWRYPAQGLLLQMASPKKGGPKTLLALTASAPSSLRTARGIGMGSSLAEVRKAYGSVQDREQSVTGKTFVAGSIYGGVIFQLKNGRVAEIFLGAAAE